MPHRAHFQRMEDSTQQDWQLIGGEFMQFAKNCLIVLSNICSYSKGITAVFRLIVTRTVTNRDPRHARWA
jgi:hypothetical protein